MDEWKVENRRFGTDGAVTYDLSTNEGRNAFALMVALDWYLCDHSSETLGLAAQIAEFLNGDHKTPMGAL